MRGPRRRTRRRARTRGPIVTACGVLVVVVAVLGAGLPAASFTYGEVPRTSDVDVVSDERAALALDTASEVTINDTSKLVTVTNQLGRGVTVTVTLRSDSADVGDIVVDGTNHGSETSFSLARGANETVRIKIPDDSSLTDDVVYFHVKASAPGLAANARDRSAPVNA